jgi:hypothetical protein
MRQPAASQPQATNVVQPQQPMPPTQGQQQFRFRTPMTNNQQGQAGNNTSGNVSAGPGRGAPSLGPGAGVSRQVNSEGLLVLTRSLSQQVGSGQTRFRTQELELEEVGSQAAAAKGTLLSAVADRYCQDQ